MYNDEEAARPYARALVQAAQETGQLERVRGDIEALADQWEGSQEFRDWATAFHSMSREQHKAAIDALWGDTMSPPVKVLLETLSINGGLAAIPHVIRCFHRFANALEGRIEVTFVFADTPRPETVASLTERALAAYGPHTQIQTKISPALGAGLVVRAGNLQIDGSLAGRLRRLRYAFAH